MNQCPAENCRQLSVWFLCDDTEKKTAFVMVIVHQIICQEFYGGGCPFANSLAALKCPNFTTLEDLGTLQEVCECWGLSKPTFHRINKRPSCKLSADLQRVRFECRYYQTDLRCIFFNTPMKIQQCIKCKIRVESRRSEKCLARLSLAELHLQFSVFL